MRKPETPATELPETRREQLSGWAWAERGSAYVWRPTNVAEMREIFTLARRAGTTIALRGAGNSYNDATLNRDAIVMDLTQRNHILDWNAATGVMIVEAGVTIGELWRRSLPDGWWPPIVPGTMTPTIGGCIAMNVHGKNAWKLGSFGEHILALELLAPSGDLLTLTPESTPELFRAVIGGLGLLGVVTAATIQLKPVVSGLLRSSQHVARNLREMFAIYMDESDGADYLVGWIDGFAAGKAAGRGLIQSANIESHPAPKSLSPLAQEPPERIAGVFPRSSAWRMLKLIFNDPGMWLANNAQFAAGAIHSHLPTQHIPFAQYHFFHDYIPGWRQVALPYGLRQFQVFAPTNSAYDLFDELLERTHRAGITPYLATLKRHRADTALLHYQVEGYSLSLDYLITSQNRDRLQTMLEHMRERALDAGARFYMAKDDLLTATDYRRSVGDAELEEFLAIKTRLDPDQVLSSSMFRRILGPQAQ